MDNIKYRISTIISQMSQGTYEREEVISLSLLAALSGESIFLLGLPGVGKSMIARRLKMAFKDAKVFEYLMSRFSTPDEIFGPVSISKLKDNDMYERVVDGYLPTADVVFLDEIWKAGPAIQNSLLTALNERVFRNGNTEIKLPIKAVIAASNELPAENEGLEALWDRFLVRYVVPPIQNRKTFLKLITEEPQGCHIDVSKQFKESELKEFMSKASNVVIPDSIQQIIGSIHDMILDETIAKRMKMSDKIPYVSDRRWRKITGVLRMSAFLNGRDAVDISDCFLLNHMIWDNSDQISDIQPIIAECVALMLISGDTTDIEDFNHNSITTPLGHYIVEKEDYYVFSAGGDDVLIKRQTYESLTKAIRYGTITNENELLIAKNGGPYTVRKPKEGTIQLNTFEYELKRDSNLRTGNTSAFLEKMNSSMFDRCAEAQKLLDDNIFLDNTRSNQQLIEAFQKGAIKKNDFKIPSRL